MKRIEKKYRQQPQHTSSLPLFTPPCLMYRVLFVCCVRCCNARFFFAPTAYYLLALTCNCIDLQYTTHPMYNTAQPPVHPYFFFAPEYLTLSCIGPPSTRVATPPRTTPSRPPILRNFFFAPIRRTHSDFCGPPGDASHAHVSVLSTRASGRSSLKNNVSTL